ncbi:PLEC protein, partial [Leiothrix lutea]|nr:PLEC protein [Leiothrix lutea]
QVTVHKNDTCALVNQSQPQQWRVLSAAGTEAVVPSVCFLLPPPNKEALEAVHRLETSHQQLLGLWQQLYQDLRSLRSWQLLTRDIQQIQSWTHITFRTLPAEEVRQVLCSLESHYQEFLRDSQDAQSFQPDDRLQVERDYNACTHKYELLLRSQEKGGRPLSAFSERQSGCPQAEWVSPGFPPGAGRPQRDVGRHGWGTAAPRGHTHMEGIQKNLAKVSEKTEQVLAQPEQAGSAPVLRSELEVTLRKMEQVYSLSSIYLEKLKTIGLVIRSTQGAEELLRKYEEQLKDVQAVPADLAELEASKAELKRLRAEAEGHQPFFSTLETDLGKAKDVNERMVRGHSERDVDLERYRERVQQLLERWQAVLGQADLRQRELDQLGRQLRYYRQSCDALRQWIADARQRQEAIQAVPITDSQAVRQQLLQEKKLLEECEQHKEKVEECQRYAKQYIDAIKDYELQLVSFKAQVEPVASPAKKPKVQSASDSIIQEYVDLRTQYSELTTLTTQYIKFITETLRRLEDEEVGSGAGRHGRLWVRCGVWLPCMRCLCPAGHAAASLTVHAVRVLRHGPEPGASCVGPLADPAPSCLERAGRGLNRLNCSLLLRLSRKGRLCWHRPRTTPLPVLLPVLRPSLSFPHGRGCLCQPPRRGSHGGDVHAARIVFIAWVPLALCPFSLERAFLRCCLAPVACLPVLSCVLCCATRLLEAGVTSSCGGPGAEAIPRASATPPLSRQCVAGPASIPRRDRIPCDLSLSPLSVPCTLFPLQKAAEKLKEEERKRLAEVEAQLEKQRQLAEAHAKAKAQAEAEARELQLRMQEEVTRREVVAVDAEQQKQNIQQELMQLRQNSDHQIKSKEAKRQRQLAEDEATRQRAEAERILKEKLAAINEASRLKAEAEIALKEKEAENERLRRLAEDEAYQRKLLEEQAAQHKQDIEEKIALLKRSSESELERQKGLVEDTLRQRRQVEEEIRALKASFERASAGKSELERELNRIRGEAEEVQRSREQAEQEAERQRALALEEEARRREAEEKVQAILAAEEEAGRQRRLALEEVERLRAMVEEARRQKELAEKESERQIQLAREAAQKRIAAEEKAHLAAVQQKEQELLQTRQQEQSLLDRLRDEAERARRAAEEAEFARGKAEQDASLSRQRVEEAERLKQRAEEEAQAKAQAQADAEKLRKEAELEAAKRAQAEQAALRQKQLADAEMEKHKKFAEQTLRQKAQVEQELTKVKLQLDETDHQKGILDEELQRLKEEVTDAVRQKAQVEEELFKVRVQMEELAKLKSRIEEENKALILKDKDNTQKFLAEEAEKMKQVAEEVARLSVEAQEAARMRQLAEDDLAQQRALAEKMLKEKMQAVQEATRLRAEAEMLQKQKDLAQEHAKKLQEDKEQMQQRLAEETEGFQKTLEAEQRRSRTLNPWSHGGGIPTALLPCGTSCRVLLCAELPALVLGIPLECVGNSVPLCHPCHLSPCLNPPSVPPGCLTILFSLPPQMQVAQQAQLRQETQLLQQSFLTEKDALLQKEKFIEEEKLKLEKLFKDEVNKAQNLKAEQERQQQEMEQEKQQLKAMLDEAKKHQKEAEENVRHKQEELQQLERQRQQQEKLLEEENKKLRERLEQMQEEYKAALAQRREIMIQTDDLPGEAVTTTQLLEIKAVPNGRDAVDGLAQNGEPEFAFDGIRQKVSAEKLADAGILSRESLDKLVKGVVSVGELSQREDVKKYLQGKSSIAGLLIKPSNQKMSIYEAMKKKLLSPGTALILLEAQAASGFIIDPVRNTRLSVNEAVREGVIGPELHNKMLSAERAVTGYKDPYTGDKISLFQAMQKDLIVRDHGIRLLEAQIATGGIIDPVNSHRLPVEAAYKRGYFDEEMNQVLSDPTDDTKGFFDPNTQENLTYLQLMERYIQLQKTCHRDKQTGLWLLPLSDKAIQSQQEEVYTDSQAKECFDKATIEVPVGSMKGQTMTIWELIHSEYFTEDHRRELLRQYKTGKVTIEKIIKIVITIIEEAETKKQEKLTFSGLRAPVPASELLESCIISKTQYEQLKEGKKSVKDLSETDAVRRFLHGSDCIAGVYVEATKEKLNIYEAMKRNLLRPSTAVVLLEAQAATGFLIDPVKNRKLYVNEAVKAGIVGPELHEKLLSAEKAVTGYKDPYSGDTISLFQAMKKGLIVKEHGIRLLEAQIATGGIIDPVHSHRLPVEVAYKRGYLDEEMSRTLSDPTDDTKGFFDPNTQENLTYVQLKERCIEDPETGLYLLPLREPEKPKVVETTHLYTEAETRKVFEETQVDIPVGSRAGSSMSLWEIMHSDLLPEEQRKHLMEEFQSGRVSKERMIIIIIEIIEKTEIIRQQNLTSYDYVRRRITAEDLYEAKIISQDIYNLLKQGSKTFRELLDVETVWKYLYGSGCVAGIYIPSSKQTLSVYQAAMKKGIIRPGTAFELLEAQAATGYVIDPIKGLKLTVEEAVRMGIVGPEFKDKLLSAERAVTGYRDPYTGKLISLFQAMKKGLILKDHGIRLLEAQIATGGIIDPEESHRLPVEVAYKRGLFDEEMNEILLDPSDDTKGFFDPNTEENLTYLQLMERCITDPETGLCLLPLK